MNQKFDPSKLTWVLWQGFASLECDHDTAGAVYGSLRFILEGQICRIRPGIQCEFATDIPKSITSFGYPTEDDIAHMRMRQQEAREFLELFGYNVVVQD